MQQLSATDTVFLTQESERAPMHISFLLLYEPARKQGGAVRFKDVLRALESQLDKSPVFRRKLLQVPLGLDNPYWVEDDAFNLEAHVHHIALPQPGDWHQFSNQLAHLHARILDRSRPLWEAYVIEGLDNVDWLPKDSFAIFLKIHHAAIDGVAGLEIVSAIHDREPVAPPQATRREKPPASNTGTESAPSQSRLLARAGFNSMRQPARMVQAVGKLIPVLSRARTANKTRQSRPTPGQKQRQTRFGGTITAKRATDSCFFKLQDIKAIKSAVPGATINDVVIAIISGAMRRYLLAKSALPEESLVCGVPVSTRTDEDTLRGGNRVGMLSMIMCTDIADPLQRLKQVQIETTLAKEYSQAVGAGTMLTLSESIPPLLMAVGIRAALQLQLMTDSSLPMNTTVTNVPGSRVPLYLCRAKLVRTAAFPPVSNGMGLVHAVLSHEDGLSISIAACREMLPDPAFYTECVNASFHELQDATKNVRRRNAGRPHAPGHRNCKMQQLSGMDNLFIQVERQGLPQHIGGVGIFDPSTAAGGKVRFKDIVDLFASRSHLSPIFRRKLVDVPFGLDRPYWVEDQEFDPEFHVRHIALPQPGDWRQLCILTARIHARPLDLSRPLWEAYVIEGLNNVEGVPAGSFALLTKIHHSVMDGVSGMQFYGALMDATPAPRSVEPTPQVLERIPSNAELFTKAYINNLRKPKQVLQFLKEVLGSRARLKSGREQHSFHELGDIPKTRFQGKISKSRVVDAVQFDFAHFRAIKNRIAGATINDVALTVVAGAMRAYLDSKGELPEESLVAGCPVDVREDGERDADGNMVGYMYISMRTDIADPLQRLAAVHDESVSAKAYLTAFGPRTGIHLLDTVPSGIMTLALRAASITGLSDASVTNNTVVTNVPGAGTSYYLAGARSVRQMSLGTLLPNVGLFQTITSQVLDNKGTLFISFVACREMLPDPAFYAQCLRDSFAALHRAARAKPVKQGKTSKKRRR